MTVPTMPTVLQLPDCTMVESTDEVRLATYELDGPGRDALLVHANGFCAGVLAPLAKALAPWHSVAFDARAHGRSSAPERRSSADTALEGPANMAWEGHCEDVLAVVDHVGMDRPIGIGHSMGGAALLLAEQKRPGTFAALWLFEPIVFPPAFSQSTHNPLTDGALRRRAHFNATEEAFANYVSKPPLNELNHECLAAYVQYGFVPDEHGGITLACRPEDEAAGYQMGVHHDAWDDLASVHCPVVIARGLDTLGGPAAIAGGIVERLANGRLEEHPELGHFGPLAQPEALAQRIRALADDC